MQVRSRATFHYFLKRRHAFAVDSIMAENIYPKTRDDTHGTQKSLAFNKNREFSSFFHENGTQNIISKLFTIAKHFLTTSKSGKIQP